MVAVVAVVVMAVVLVSGCGSAACGNSNSDYWTLFLLWKKIQLYFAFIIFKLLISLNAFIVFVEEGENVDIYIHTI